MSVPVQFLHNLRYNYMFARPRTLHNWVPVVRNFAVHPRNKALAPISSVRYLSTTLYRCCSDDSKGPPGKKLHGELRKNDAHTQIEYETQFRENYKNPVERTIGILADDLKQYFGEKRNAIKNVVDKLDEKSNSDDTPKEQLKENESTKKDQSKFKAKASWPAHCDVLVIGGGAMGSSIAYHLKERAMKGLNVVVVEQDSTYSQASTVLSVGGIRQQFSIPENIQLSLYGMQFLRKAPELLAVEGGEVPDMQFNPGGYLTLASEAGVEFLRENLRIQREVGAKVDLLSARKLKERFPWINTEGIEAGVIGLENEGWFDPWSLLSCLRRKAIHLGAHYVNGEVTSLKSIILDDVITEGVDTCLKHVRTAEITLPNGEQRDIHCAIVIVAAGAWSGQVGRMLGIGNGRGMLETPIPIEPRKRYVYCVHAPDGPGLDCPLVIDPDHTYFRREGLGGLYLCGQSPGEHEEPPADNLEVDEKFFEERVWPKIANRAPAFENAKLKSSWAGYYDYNTFDQNGIVGLHPSFGNVFIASGFSGHGIQQAPAVGRAVMELILHGEYVTIDLERFAFERILMRHPLLERGIV